MGVRMGAGRLSLDQHRVVSGVTKACRSVDEAAGEGHPRVGSGKKGGDGKLPGGRWC